MVKKAKTLQDSLMQKELGEETVKHNTTEEEHLTMFLKRFEEMEKGRGEYERIWRYIDLLMDQKPTVTVSGLSRPNMPIEEALIETRIGMIPEGLPFEVGSDGRPDGILNELAKLTLDHFIKKERIIEQIKVKFDFQSARYGTGILFSGLWTTHKFINISEKTEYLSEAKLEKKDKYHIGVKNVNIYNAWFDPVADYDDAIDCVYMEEMSVSEFKARFYDENVEPIKGYINIEAISSQYDQGKESIKIYHYYNKVMGYYWIVADKQTMIYDGYATTKHGELPLIAVQHYYNHKSIYGVGVVQRYSYIKGINNNILADVIGGSRLNASSFLIQGSGVATEGEIYADPGEVGIIELTSGDSGGMVPFSPQVNVAQLRDIITLLDDYSIILTGLNFKAPYSSAAKTAFEVSVMQEEQNGRAKTPALLRNMGVGRAFTIMLCNILQYAPYLMAKRIWDDTTKKSVVDHDYSIPVIGKKIVWKGESNPVSEMVEKEFGKSKDKKSKEEKKMIQKTYKDIVDILDDDGYNDYFEMSEGFFPSELLEDAGAGLKVNIETPSTQSTMKAVEIENFAKYIEMKMIVNNAKIASMNSGGEDLAQREQIEKKMNMLFNISEESIMLESGGDKFKKALAQMNELIAQIQPLSLSNNLDANDMMDPQANPESLLQGSNMDQQGAIPTPAGMQANLGQAL